MSNLKSNAVLVGMLVLLIACKSKTENSSTPSNTGIKPDTTTSAFKNTVSPGSVLTSIDTGKTWQPIAEGLPGSLQATGIGTLGHEIVLASREHGLFMTDNKGSHWKDISTGLATKKINTLYVEGDELYLGLNHEGVTMWKLHSDYWNSYNASLPNRNVWAITKVKDELVVGTDMGIFKSVEHKQSWNGKHIGEPVTCFAAKGDTLFAGTGKGVLLSKDGGEKWVYVRTSGKVYGMTLIDNILYVQFASGELIRTKAWGSNWQEIKYGPTDKTPVYSIMKINDQYLLSDHSGIYISDNGETKWNLIYPTHAFPISAMTVLGQRIYGTVISE